MNMVIDFKFNDSTTDCLKVARKPNASWASNEWINICISNVTNITLTAHKRRQVY